MTQAQRLAALFGQEAHTSCVPSAVSQDLPEAALPLASARALLEEYGEQPSLVTETGDGFLISSDQHAIFMGGDSSVDVQEIEPAADADAEPTDEQVGHDQEELNRWFYDWQFPDEATHKLARQLSYDILQSRSGGATDGVWMRELVRRTAAGKYASLRKYLTPTVVAYGSGQLGESAEDDETYVEDVQEDMPRELSLDDFFYVDNFPDYATAQRAARALEAARQSTDTATENAIAKRLYAAMPPDLRKYMHPGFHRMLQAEGVAPPPVTRVVWESDAEEHPTIHVLEGEVHRLLLTPADSALHGFTEDDIAWLASGEIAREVYGLPDDVDYVYASDDAAQDASQPLTELGYVPTMWRQLTEASDCARMLSRVRERANTADVLADLLGESASPAVLLYEQKRLATLQAEGWVVETDGVLALTEQATTWLQDPTVQALLSVDEAFAPQADVIARDVLRNIRERADQDPTAASNLFRGVVEALYRHGRSQGYVTESESVVVPAEFAPVPTATAPDAGTVIETLEATLTPFFTLQAPTEAQQAFMLAFDKAKAEGHVAHAWTAFESIRDLALEALDEVTDTSTIKATHPGITGLPSSAWTAWSTQKLAAHFAKLAGKIGKGPTMRAVMNIERWNKNQNPALSKKAREVIDTLKKSKQYLAASAGEGSAWHDVVARQPEQVVEAVQATPAPVVKARTVDAPTAAPTETEVAEVDSTLDEIRRLTTSQLAKRMKARIKLARNPEHRKELKAQRKFRKLHQAQFARVRKAYMHRYRPRMASAEEPEANLIEVAMDILTVPAESVAFYVDACALAGFEPETQANTTDETRIDIHAPGAVIDAVETYLFMDETAEADDDTETPAAVENTPATTGESAEDATPSDTALRLGGALLALEGAIPPQSGAWGDVKTALTFLLGNGMVAEAQALVTGIQAGDLSEFDADVLAGSTVSGAYTFGTVTPHKAMQALSNLNARVTGGTVRESNVPTILDAGLGRKASVEEFNAVAATVETAPVEEERGPGIVFKSYKDDETIVAQEVSLPGHEPVYLVASIPEGAADAWAAVRASGTHPQRGDQPKPPVDVGAEGTPKNVSETTVLRVASASLREFLTAAKQAGAPTDAPVQVEGTHVHVTLPVEVAERVVTLFENATVVEPALAD